MGSAKYAGWRWATRNNMWLQINEGSREAMLRWMGLMADSAAATTNGSGAGSDVQAFCVQRASKGGPQQSPEVLVTLEQDDVHVTIVGDNATLTADDAPAADDVPTDAAPDHRADDRYAKQVTDARDVVRYVLSYTANLPSDLLEIVGPDAPQPLRLEPAEAGDAVVEVDNALRGLRHAYRILSDHHDRVTDARP